MPYISTEEMQKFEKYKENKKKEYKRINEYNKKKYIKMTVTVPMQDGRNFQRICKSMGLSVNQVIKGLVFDFLSDFKQGQVVQNDGKMVSDCISCDFDFRNGTWDMSR